MVDAEQIGVSLQAVANWQPETVQRFVYQEWAQPNKPINFNWWLGLAEAAVSKTFESESVNLQWGLTAVTIYQLLVSHDPVGSAEISLMRLKARLLRYFGDAEAIPFVSVHEIVNWFLHDVPMTYLEADTLLSAYQQERTKVPTASLRQLRTIKTQLSVIELLQDFEQIKENADINLWLELKDRLP